VASVDVSQSPPVERMGSFEGTRSRHSRDIEA